MVTHPPRPAGRNRRHLRHIAGIFRQDRNPAARVYESIGSDSFLAPAPGWLNLGLWEGPGSEDEAATACRRLVQTIAAPLPEAGVILDVGNGLGTQEPVIAEVARPRRLIAVNITEWQLSAGHDRLREAAALGVASDATRLPIAGHPRPGRTTRPTQPGSRSGVGRAVRGRAREPATTAGREAKPADRDA
jgi:hypothetical protein